jgi:hypothetical protein
MASQVIRNMDLLQRIYEFGDVGHREKMKKIAEQIELLTDISETISAFCDSDYWDRKTIAYICFLKECYTMDERIEFSKRLLRCNCCSRHSHYKTVSFKPTNPVPESTNHKNCGCNCRFMYRRFKLGQVID